MKPLLALVLVSVTGLSLPLHSPNSPQSAQDSQEHPGPAVATSEACALCHSNIATATAMRDARGRGIAPFDLWRSSMMANAARDPLWRAAVSAEIAALPTWRAEIEEKCSSCHAPMASRLGLDDHGTGTRMHVFDCESTLGDFARDGVSCTICHGIRPEGLGEEESFTGGYVLDEHRRMFGPHDRPLVTPMVHHTSFTPAQGDHVLRSELCATCHTLVSHPFDRSGDPTDTSFLEQAPYLEWRNSVFAESSVTCQGCHMPTSDEDGRPIETYIARNPGGRNFPPTEPRTPFGRHLLVGGNTLVLSMLRDHGEQLGASASADAFQATIDATREQLRQRTASVTIADVRGIDDTLCFDVVVTNLAGHKLPTGHPTRRAWVRVTVRGTAGEVLFCSGGTDDQGRLVDADGQVLDAELANGPHEVHRDTIRSSDQVATYEAIMADDEGLPTYTLLRGHEWLRDNRLLPRGWHPDHADAARTAPVGTTEDPDFVGGGDHVHYRLPLVPESVSSIEVALLYQTLSPRWAAQIFEWNTPEIELFRQLWDAADRSPEVLATARWNRGSPADRSEDP